jgi:hypothetical protein
VAAAHHQWPAGRDVDVGGRQRWQARVQALEALGPRAVGLAHGLSLAWQCVVQG